MNFHYCTDPDCEKCKLNHQAELDIFFIPMSRFGDFWNAMLGRQPAPMEDPLTAAGQIAELERIFSLESPN